MSAQDADGRKENGKTMGAQDAERVVRPRATIRCSELFTPVRLPPHVGPHMPARRQDFALDSSDNSRLGAYCSREPGPRRGRPAENLSVWQPRGHSQAFHQRVNFKTHQDIG